MPCVYRKFRVAKITAIYSVLVDLFLVNRTMKSYLMVKMFSSEAYIRYATLSVILMSNAQKNYEMKKHLTGKTVTIVYFLIGCIVAGCSKEADVKPSLFSSKESQILQTKDNAVPDTLAIVRFLRQPFISQVNTTTRTDSTVLIFDFTLRKNFMKGEKNSVSIAYGDPQFVDRGWKYEITIDTKTSKILLSPNDKMKAEIVGGSFKTVLATFDQSTQNFNFITRFEELNGNKSEVAETIFPK